MKKVYNKRKILETLDKFKIEHKDLKVTTYFDGRVLASVDVSKKYYTFDFAEFTKEIQRHGCTRVPD